VERENECAVDAVAECDARGFLEPIGAEDQ
jgi:hypothetical protein